MSAQEHAGLRLNGILKEEPGEVLDRRLYLSRNGETWFVEFNDGDTDDGPQQNSGASDSEKPPTSIVLKPGAKILEGRFVTADEFLKLGVTRRAPHDTIDIDRYDDWYNEPSRGIGCFQDANIVK